jgi:hypothetical protein
MKGFAPSRREAPPIMSNIHASAPVSARRDAHAGTVVIPPQKWECEPFRTQGEKHSAPPLRER